MRTTLISASSVIASAGGHSSALLQYANCSPSVGMESTIVWMLPPFDRFNSWPLRWYPITSEALILRSPPFSLPKTMRVAVGIAGFVVSFGFRNRYLFGGSEVRSYG